MEPLYRFLYSQVREYPQCPSVVAHNLPDDPQQHLETAGSWQRTKQALISVFLSTEGSLHPTRLEDFCFLGISFIYSCSQLGILPDM